MSERKIKFAEPPKRAQSVPKRVQIVTAPRVYAARPQQLFDYSLTSANFPDDAPNESAMMETQYNPPQTEWVLFTVKNMVLLFFTCFLAYFITKQTLAWRAGRGEQTLKDLQASGQIVVPVHQIMQEEAKRADSDARVRAYSVVVALILLVITFIMWMKTC